MYLKLNRPIPSKLKPRKELKYGDVFFKTLFMGLGEQKKCNLLQSVLLGATMVGIIKEL